MAELKKTASGQLRLAVGLSLALLALRLNTAHGLGFGDSEALYASYALHPQASYLDHPGLIGYLMRLLGGGKAPSPELAHAVSSVVATLVPWLGAVAARATGVAWDRALRTMLGLALVPELSIGLFGVSPDLPLAALWLAALALAAHLTRLELEQSSGAKTLWPSLALGVVLGLGVLAKVSMVLLAAALLAFSLTPRMRPIWRGAGPWAGLACAAILVLPLVLWESSRGMPMLEHRLVTTQSEAGFSLRNVTALLGGQLLYVTPPFLLAAYHLARHVHRQRTQDEVARLLWLAAMVPALPLILLCLWSTRAEPHWVAPAYLSLAIQAARADVVSPRLAKVCLSTGAALTLLIWSAVKTDAYVRLATSSFGRMFGQYRPRYDLTNDLYAWGPGRQLLRDALGRAVVDSRRLPVVVGAPHWMICAQAQAAVQNQVPVGCLTPYPTDFDGWSPREKWQQAPVVLLVEDSRYPVDWAGLLVDRRLVESSQTRIRRAGVVVRVIRVLRLDLDRATASDATPTPSSGR